MIHVQLLRFVTLCTFLQSLQSEVCVVYWRSSFSILAHLWTDSESMNWNNMNWNNMNWNNMNWNNMNWTVRYMCMWIYMYMDICGNHVLAAHESHRDY